MWLVNLSIHRPVFISMVICFLMVLGMLGYQKIGVDQFPKVDPPVVTVTTQYPGAGPQEIETLVSKKIEEAVNQIGGIERLMSTSRESVSQVVIEFKLDEVNIRDAQVEVRDKIARIRNDLPRDIEEPLVERLNFADRPVMHMALRALTKKENGAPSRPSDAILFGMRDLAENRLKQKLQQVDGVGQVLAFGGLEREIQVDVDRQKILFWKLGPTEIAAAIKASNLNVPGGEIREEPSSRSLRVMGEFGSMADVAETIVKVLPGGRVLRVGDLATVRDSYKDVKSVARLNGDPVVLLEVKKQTDANTIKVVDGLKNRLPEINELLPAGVEVVPVFDGSRKISMSLHDVVETIVIAAILAIVVIYFFLGSLQSTLITGLALPMSVITTFFALYICDFTLNTMTLLGISLSVGLILDDAIVVRENIWKKIEEGMPAKEAAYQGTKQVFIAVIATSLTIIATFLPVAFLPGVVGKFFVSFALTVCIVVMCSLLDALTMAPMLSAYLISANATHGDHSKRPRLLQKFEDWGAHFSAWYGRVLARSLHNPGKVLAGATVLFFVSLYAGKFIGFTFLPTEEMGEMDINIEAPPGSTILKTDSIARTIEQSLATEPEVDTVSVRLGNEFDDTNLATLYVRLVPAGERSRSTGDMMQHMRTKLMPLAKQERLVLGVSSSGGGGGGKPINVAIQGAEIDRLTAISDEVLKEARASVNEVVNLDSSMRPGRNEIQLQIDRTRLLLFGLSTESVGNTIRGLFEGVIGGQYRDRGEEYDIRVRFPAGDRGNTTTLPNLTIANTRGEAIPLSAVTTTRSGSSPTKIVRVNQTRAAVLEGDLMSGAPLATAIGKLKAIIDPKLPQGYRSEFQGQAKSMRDLGVGAMVALFLGALFIYMIMASLYESLVLPFAILLTLPLAIVGALVALLGFGKLLDLYAVIGIIMLMGLVTKNAILVVDYVEQLRAEGMERMEALLDGGVRRLRPIMMTTIAMVAGMVPVAIGYGELNKARSAMGVATIGGLLSSTLLSLLVVPCAYIYLDDFRMWATRLVKKWMGAAAPTEATA